MQELIKNFEKIKVRLFKFLLVGGICTAINYVIFYILFKYYDVNYILSSVIGYIIGLIIGYYINKFWTYEVAKDSDETFVYKYLLVYMVSLASGALFLKLLVEYLLINALISNIFSIGLSTLLNFLGTNFLVFKQKDHPNL